MLFRSVRGAYRDGAEIAPVPWEIWGENDTPKRVKGPREFVHALSTLVNAPIQRGFKLLGAWEDGVGDANDRPGSWGHFTAVCPPYLVFWWQLGTREGCMSVERRVALDRRSRAGK